MCTLLAAVGLSSEVPLLIAANRDERLDRPAEGPKLWSGPVPFIAPVDSMAGGTWLGLNARGLVVGITNRFLSPRDNSKESRGTLVVDSLSAPSAQKLRERLGSLDAARYNPFHLFYADRESAYVSYLDEEGFHHLSLSPGLHVVTERSFSTQPPTRAEWVMREAASLDVAQPLPWFELLRRHNLDSPLDSICIHAPQFNYGTRSSAVIQLHADPTRTRMWSSEGPACQGSPVDQGALLQHLFSP